MIKDIFIKIIPYFTSFCLGNTANYGQVNFLLIGFPSLLWYENPQEHNSRRFNGLIINSNNFKIVDSTLNMLRYAIVCYNSLHIIFLLKKSIRNCLVTTQKTMDSYYIIKLKLKYSKKIHHIVLFFLFILSINSWLN